MDEGLNIEAEEKQKKIILHIEGRIDTTSAPIIERKMQKFIEEQQRIILLDFKKVSYLTSAGMRLLLSMTKKLQAVGGRMGVFNINDEVMEIIKMAGFEQVLTLYHSEAEAVSS